MHISRLVLDHFRSWEHCVLDLEPGVTILEGRNGLGKTNLVEAIEVLSTGGSHRTSSSLPLVERGQSKATVRARLEQDGTATDYELTIAAKGANRGRINGGPSLYQRDLVGRVPCVTFSPEDQLMVSGEPAARRAVLDQAGSQLDADYFQVRQDFRHVARQRAALLKQLSQAGRDPSGDGRDAALSGLEVWTGQFIRTGLDLSRRRAALVEALDQLFSDLYGRLAGPDQDARLTYRPSLEEIGPDGQTGSEVAEAVSRHFQRIYPGEVARGTNLIGPQRDDLAFTLNGMPAREFASNGEMWTLALALRLALLQVVKDRRSLDPIVILDDVFAQLDRGRRDQILDFARQQDQVLITVAADSDIPSLQGASLVDVSRLRPAQPSDPAAQDPAIASAMQDLRRTRGTAHDDSDMKDGPEGNDLS